MSRQAKLILWIAAGFGGLAVLLVVAAALWFRAHAKPRLEVAVSSALDMQVTVGGPVTVGFAPGLHVALADVRARKRGAEIASAAAIDCGIEILPLLRGEIRIRSLDLRGFLLAIERDRDGTLNVSRAKEVPASDATWSVDKLSVSDATFRYSNLQSGGGVEATDCSLDAGSLQFRSKAGADDRKGLSLSAQLACGRIQTDRIAVSDVRSPVNGKDGIFDLDPLRLRLLGGQGSGRVRLNLTGEVPVYDVQYAVTQFQVDDFFRFVSPKNAERKKLGDGSLDFTTQLRLQGKSVEELTQSATGTASVRGGDVTLEIGDLDHKFARFEASQNFTLVDLGAAFFAGPLGLGITKGYDFARVFEGGSGSTAIRVLVSEWQVERGVAQATDAAMATGKNRVAMRGNLDFVNGRFDDVTVALIDDEGCALAKQKIRGPFGQAEVEKPDVLGAVTGPARKLVAEAKDLLGGKCKVFYAGSVEPPD